MNVLNKCLQRFSGRFTNIPNLKNNNHKRNSKVLTGISEHQYFQEFRGTEAKRNVAHFGSYPFVKDSGGWI